MSPNEFRESPISEDQGTSGPNGGSLGEKVEDRGIAGTTAGGKYAAGQLSAVKSTTTQGDIDSAEAENEIVRTLRQEMTDLTKEGDLESDIPAAQAEDTLARMQKLLEHTARELAETQTVVAALQAQVRDGQPTQKSLLAEVGNAVLRLAISTVAGGGMGTIISVVLDDPIMDKTVEGLLGGVAGGAAGEATRNLGDGQKRGHVIATSRQALNESTIHHHPKSIPVASDDSDSQKVTQDEEDPPSIKAGTTWPADSDWPTDNDEHVPSIRAGTSSLADEESPHLADGKSQRKRGRQLS